MFSVHSRGRLDWTPEGGGRQPVSVEGAGGRERHEHFRLECYRLLRLAAADDRRASAGARRRVERQLCTRIE